MPKQTYLEWYLKCRHTLTHIHTHIHTSTYTHTHTYTHTQTHLCIHLHIHTHTQTQYAHTFTYKTTHTQTHIHTNTYTHTHTHAHTHTSINHSLFPECFGYLRQPKHVHDRHIPSTSRHPIRTKRFKPHHRARFHCHRTSDRRSTRATSFPP
jgi:hypothetical protein